MSYINDISDSEILSSLSPEDQEKLNKIYYLDELIDQIIKNNEIPKLIEEIYDFLKEAEIASTKKEAKSFINALFQKILEARKIKEEEELSDDSDNEDEDDEQEETTEGQCEMCLTVNKKITLHHAIPKLTIKRFSFKILNKILNFIRMKRKKKKAPVIFIKLCRECHS